MQEKESSMIELFSKEDSMQLLQVIVEAAGGRKGVIITTSA